MVRFIVSKWALLTLDSQAELVIDTRVTAPDTLHGVANTHTIVSDVRNDAVNTRTAVPNVHRNTLRSSGDTSGQTLEVSVTYARMSQIDRLPLPRLTLGRRSQLQMGPAADICIQCTR